MDAVHVARIIPRMDKAEWWQSPVVPAAFCGAVLLTLGFAFCRGSKSAPPTEAAPARPAADPAEPSPPDDLSAATTASAPATPAPIAPKAPVTKAEATAMLTELHALEKLGREMAVNRYKGDLSTATPGDMTGQRRCMDGMREARPRLDKIRSRTGALPDAVISIGLGVSELGVCLTCVQSADEACARAKTALRDADRELARIRW